MKALGVISSLIADKYTEQGVLFGQLNRESYRLEPAQTFPTISHITLYIIVLRGEIRAVINNIGYISTHEKHNLVNIRFADKVTDIRLSEDFRGYLLAISPEFMDEAGKISLYGLTSMRTPNVITLAKNNTKIITDYCRIIEENADPADNPLDTSVFRFAVQLCHFKILQHIFPVSSVAKSNATRASMLCTRFFALIDHHIETQHNVGFYAGTLNITPHYLTRITNEYIGLPANKIIINELISRASFLLQDPEYTLQQIADRLYFYDQSSFGKFFKKYTGKTPANYRKNSC